MDNESLLQRILEIRDKLHISHTMIARKSGISEANFSRMMRQKQPITDKTLQRIANALPISLEWLRTGEGEMMTSAAPRPGETASCELVPLIPFAACAGSFAGYLGEGVSLRQCEMVVAPVHGCSLAIDVSGDSMEPDFPNGCRVFVRKLEDMSFVPWGHTFVVDTDNGAFLKRLFPGAGNMIVAKSINTDYPPFDIPTASIRGIYRVVMMARVFAAT